LCTIKNWKEKTDKQFQIHQTDDLQNLLNKFTNDIIKGIEVLDVSQGIVPYSKEHLSEEEIKNRIYHANLKLDNSYGIWVQGRAINRYSINLDDHEFLKYGKWLHRPRKSKYFNKNRILIQEITGGKPPRISATIYDGILYHDPGIISCINISIFDIKYILAIINSKLISWYHVINSPKGKRTTFPKVLIGDIRNIPIKVVNSNFQNEISKKVNLLLLHSAEILKERSNFIATLKEEKKILKTTKHLSSFWCLSFDEFKKELKKQKLEFKIGDENNQWRSYFNLTVDNINQIQLKIENIDKEVDQMVYELYGLTEEEIQIVENSI